MSEAIAHGTGTEGAAAAYADELSTLVPRGPDGLPVFDVLRARRRAATGTSCRCSPARRCGTGRSSSSASRRRPTSSRTSPRVTIHPRLIAAAREVILVTTGASKAESLAQAWAGADERELPVRAARIPTATWFLDEAAAAELPRD